MQFGGKANRPLEGLSVGWRKWKNSRTMPSLLTCKTGEGGAIYWTGKTKGERQSWDQEFIFGCVRFEMSESGSG